MTRSITALAVCLVCLAVAGLLAPTVGVAQDPAGAPQPGKPQASSEAALAQYLRGVRLHNNKVYDVAAEEWTAFLKQFPKDPLAGKARYYLGVCYLQTRKFKQAAAEFKQLTDDPKFDLADDARFNLGWTQYTMAQTGDEALYAAAAKTFADMLKASPQAAKADQALYFQGECLYAQGQKQQAADIYGRVVAEHPKSKLRADALYAQGVALEESEKYPEAGAVYDTFISTCADSDLLTEVRMRKAETVMQAGEYAEAAQMFGATAAVEDFGLADHALYKQAICEVKQEQYDPAGKLFAKLCESFPKSSYYGDAAMAAGRTFYRANNASAAKWLDNVLAAGGEHYAEAAHLRCRLHLQAGEHQPAEKLAATALSKAADSPFAANLKVDQADAIYAQPTRRGEAVKLYEAVAKDDPDSPAAAQALYYAAFGSLELKQYQEALRQAGLFLKTHAEHRLAADVQYIAAESHLQLADYKQAEAGFLALTKPQYAEHPDQELWRLRLGLALYLQKKYDDVIATMTAAEQAITGKEGTAESLFLIGGSQFHKAEYKTAAESLAKSLQTAPKWRQADEAMLMLSQCQNKAGENAKAIASVEKMLAEFPQTTLKSQAHYRLGEYQFAAGDYAAAVKQYDLCLAGDADSLFVPYALYGKGWSLLKNQQHEAAETALGTLISEHADHALAVDALLARAMARRQSGKHEETLADVAAFLKTGPADGPACDALYEQGLAEVALKRFEQAAGTFESLLARQPEYPNVAEVLYEIGWAQKSLDDNPAAVKAFAKLAADHGDSPLAAEAHYHVAESLYDEKKFDQAAKQYVQSRDKSGPKTDLREKALFKLGWSLFQQDKFAEAQQQFAAQLQERPLGGLAGDGAFMNGESLFRLEKHAEALAAFNASLKGTLSSKQLDVLARLHGAQSAAQLKQWQVSFDLLADIAEKHADSPYLPECLYERGWAQQNLKNNAEAMRDYTQAADTGRGVVAARARFMMGELLFADKKFAAAVKEFQRVMFVFGDEAPPEVKNWQAKAGYEAGRCADVQIKDEKDAAKRAQHIEDAKKFYTYVVQRHAKHPLAAASQKRLEALSKL